MDKHKKLFDNIIAYASANDNVKVVLMNGSRVNLNCATDDYSDFDIKYLVKDVQRQIQDTQWIGIFVDIFIEQTKDEQRNVDHGETITYTCYSLKMDQDQI